MKDQQILLYDNNCYYVEMWISEKRIVWEEISDRELQPTRKVSGDTTSGRDDGQHD